MRDNTISDSNFAPRKRALNSLVNDLRAIGVDKEVTLPSIVVIGNQSAGKSSVVEAISGITVPRDSGTCTRCPFEIRLQHHNGPWSCKFKLRFHNVHSKAVTEVPFGHPLTDETKGDVEDRLRRAQLAVLEGDLMGVDEFLEKDIRDLPHPQKFSSDVVVVEIQGPEVVDLTFIDLPGIMQSGLREEVEALTRKHIVGESVILLTINTSDDLDNQRAHHLTREIDPQGRRTIGVLTKPDMIERGTEHRWIQALQNGDSTVTGRTHYGYYIVRRPDAEERKVNITKAAAEQKEAQFFEAAPWSQQDIHERLGTGKLVVALSNVLCRRIEEKLPDLRTAISAGLLDVKKSLRELPAPPSKDPNVQMSTLCSQLQSRLRQLIDSPEGSPLLREIKQQVYLPLAEDLELLIPVFSHLPDKPHPPDDFPDDSAVPGREVDIVTKREKPFERELIYLQQVRDIKNDSLACELPFTLPYAAKLRLIERPIGMWAEAVRMCFQFVGPILQKHVLRPVSELFERFARAQVLLKQVIAEHVEEHIALVEEQLRAYVSMDNIPFTLNVDLYRTERESTFNELHSLRTAGLLKRTADTVGHGRYYDFDYDGTLDTAVTYLAQLGLHAVKEKDLLKLLPHDEWEEELWLCADAAAFWRVAYARLKDDIPRLIHSKLFQPLPAALEELVLDKVGIGTPLCAELLAEDTDVKERRAQLEEKQSRFEEALRRFEKFERGQNE